LHSSIIAENAFLSDVEDEETFMTKKGFPHSSSTKKMTTIVLY